MKWDDAFKISIPVLVAVFGFLGEACLKEKWEQYKRKEDRYVAMLESLQGFYVSAEPSTAKNDKERFLRHLRVCWLYCPDSVIDTAYGFLNNVSTGVRKSDEEKEEALGEFVALLRKDLLGNGTKLEATDFRHLRSN